MTRTILDRTLAAAFAALLLPPAVAGAAPKPAPKATPTAAAKPMLLSMKQVTITLDQAAGDKVNADRVAAFQSATLGIFSCADVEGVAQSVGATVAAADNIPLTALPPALRETVRTMKVGTATQMFGDRNEGKVKVLVLCARR